MSDYQKVKNLLRAAQNDALVHEFADADDKVREARKHGLTAIDMVTNTPPWFRKAMRLWRKGDHEDARRTVEGY